MTGTLLNAVAVLIGTTIGTLLGNRLPDRLREIAMQALGLVTLLIGTQMALQAQNLLIVLASMVLGGVLGELLRIEDGLDAMGRGLEQRFGGRAECCPSCPERCPACSGTSALSARVDSTQALSTATRPFLKRGAVGWRKRG